MEMTHSSYVRLIKLEKIKTFDIPTNISILKNSAIFAGKHGLQLDQKETPAQMFSFEYC